MLFMKELESDLREGGERRAVLGVRSVCGICQQRNAAGPAVAA